MKNYNSFLILIVTFGCTTEPEPPKAPVLTTTAITGVSPTEVSSGGNISSDGGAVVTARGVVWGIATLPTIENNKTEDGSGTGTFTSVITGLMPEMSYYFRAYATNSAGTSYGNEVGFSTEALSVNPDVEGPFNAGLTYGQVTDVDGNLYRTIQIGDQVWMAENLRTTRYCNGEVIPNVPDPDQWVNLITGGWAYYENEQDNNYFYGKLYNWFVASDSRNPCPCGWHVPLDEEWTTLRKTLDTHPNSTANFNSAGGKMKVAGTEYWLEWNPGATNESGFSAIPAGGRNGDIGVFVGKGSHSAWYSSEAATSETAWQQAIFNFGSSIERNPTPKSDGLSIRCLRD